MQQAAGHCKCIDARCWAKLEPLRALVSLNATCAGATADRDNGEL